MIFVIFAVAKSGVSNKCKLCNNESGLLPLNHEMTEYVRLFSCSTYFSTIRVVAGLRVIFGNNRDFEFSSLHDKISHTAISKLFSMSFGQNEYQCSKPIHRVLFF